MMHEVAVNRQPTRRSSSTAEPVAVQAKALSEACLAARAACEGRDDLLGAVALGAAVGAAEAKEPGRPSRAAP